MLRALVKILLVADKPQTKELIWAAIHKHWSGPLRMECKPNLSQALDCLKSEGFDALLVDLAAPDLKDSQGIERVGEIAQKLPVIVLIDSADTDRLIRARNLGIRNWVVKETLTPFRLADEMRNALAVPHSWKRVW